MTFVPKLDDLVFCKGLQGVFKVTGIPMGSGDQCFIREFNISKQRFMDSPVLVLSSTLSPFKEDASQATARVVREATEGK